MSKTHDQCKREYEASGPVCRLYSMASHTSAWHHCPTCSTYFREFCPFCESVDAAETMSQKPSVTSAPTLKRLNTLFDDECHDVQDLAQGSALNGDCQAPCGSAQPSYGRGGSEIDASPFVQLDSGGAAASKVSSVDSSPPPAEDATCTPSAGYFVGEFGIALEARGRAHTCPQLDGTDAAARRASARNSSPSPAEDATCTPRGGYLGSMLGASLTSRGRALTCPQPGSTDAEVKAGLPRDSSPISAEDATCTPCRKYLGNALDASFTDSGCADCDSGVSAAWNVSPRSSSLWPAEDASTMPCTGQSGRHSGANLSDPGRGLSPLQLDSGETGARNASPTNSSPKLVDGMSRTPSREYPRSQSSATPTAPGHVNSCSQVDSTDALVRRTSTRKASPRPAAYATRTPSEGYLGSKSGASLTAPGRASSCQQGDSTDAGVRRISTRTPSPRPAEDASSTPSGAYPRSTYSTDAGVRRISTRTPSPRPAGYTALAGQSGSKSGQTTSSHGRSLVQVCSKGAAERRGSSRRGSPRPCEDATCAAGRGQLGSKPGHATPAQGRSLSQVGRKGAAEGRASKGSPRPAEDASSASCTLGSKSDGVLADPGRARCRGTADGKEQSRNSSLRPAEDATGMPSIGCFGNKFGASLTAPGRARSCQQGDSTEAVLRRVSTRKSSPRPAGDAPSTPGGAYPRSTYSTGAGVRRISTRTPSPRPPDDTTCASSRGQAGGRQGTAVGKASPRRASLWPAEDAAFAPKGQLGGKSVAAFEDLGRAHSCQKSDSTDVTVSVRRPSTRHSSTRPSEFTACASGREPFGGSTGAAEAKSSQIIEPLGLLEDAPSAPCTGELGSKSVAAFADPGRAHSCQQDDLADVMVFERSPSSRRSSTRQAGFTSCASGGGQVGGSMGAAEAKASPRSAPLGPLEDASSAPPCTGESGSKSVAGRSEVALTEIFEPQDVCSSCGSPLKCGKGMLLNYLIQKPYGTLTSKVRNEFLKKRLCEACTPEELPRPKQKPHRLRRATPAQTPPAS